MQVILIINVRMDFGNKKVESNDVFLAHVTNYTTLHCIARYVKVASTW